MHIKLTSTFLCLCLNVLFLQDRIIARLQQPYSLDCIPVEAEYQVSTYKFFKSNGVSFSPFS